MTTVVIDAPKDIFERSKAAFLRVFLRCTYREMLRQGYAAEHMLRRSWLKQAVGWYQCPPGTPEHSPLQTDLTGLPPMLIQAGDQELLCSDSTRLADHATRCHVDCRLEIYRGRWHMFHLQSFYLRSSVAALQTLATFALSTTRSP